MTFRFSVLRLLLAMPAFALPFAFFPIVDRRGCAIAFVVAISLSAVVLTVGRYQVITTLTRGVLELLGLLVFAIIVFIFAAGVFSNTIPPGGVSWPYFVCVLGIPAIMHWYAGRMATVFCYGFASGILFAAPVFLDGYTAQRATAGLETETELLGKILAFAVAIAVACVLSNRLGQPQGVRSRTPETGDRT